MNSKQLKTFYQACTESGIKPFNNNEVLQGFRKLKQMTLTGLRRRGEMVKDDGGLAAIDTQIEPISEKQFMQVKDNTRVIFGAYAGTNWITGLATKMNNKVSEQKLVTTSFADKSKRQFSSITSFAQMIGQQIAQAVKLIPSNNIQTLAIAYGFAQFPKITSYGREAIITADQLTKSWYIKNGKGKPLGKHLLASLKKLKLNYLKRVYFANDTTAVALDITAKSASNNSKALTALPIGVVMGTGDNVSAVFKGHKNNHLVNLEIGMARAFPADQVLAKMIKLHLVPSPENQIEFYMGGDYLLARLACAMLLLQEQEIINQDYHSALLKYARVAKITSKLAAKEVSAQELSQLLKLKISSDDLFILNKVAKRMLVKAAQVAGTMVAVSCDLAGWAKGIKGAIPIEGTVFSEAFRFREGIRRTLTLLIPQNKLGFVPGSGTRGIATEAMIRDSAGDRT